MSEPTADRVARLAGWQPWRIATDLAHVVADTWRLTGENNTTLQELRSLMADVSGTLNTVAETVRGPLSTAAVALISERDQLAARVAELTGEDVVESTAAENVRSAVNELASTLTAAPDAPNVDPLPSDPSA